MKRNLTLDEFCGLIDHTLLKPNAASQEIQRVCDRAPGIRLCVGLRQ